MTDLETALRAVITTARAWRTACGPCGPADAADTPLGALSDAVETLERALDTVAVPWEAPVQWRYVVTGDEVQLKSGTWVPVLERWTRRNGIEICVGMPVGMPGATPADELVRRSFLMPPGREVKRRPGPDSAAVALLTEALSAMVLHSKGD